MSALSPKCIYWGFFRALTLGVCGFILRARTQVSASQAESWGQACGSIIYFCYILHFTQELPGIYLWDQIFTWEHTAWELAQVVPWAVELDPSLACAQVWVYLCFTPLFRLGIWLGICLAESLYFQWYQKSPQNKECKTECRTEKHTALQSVYCRAQTDSFED